MSPVYHRLPQILHSIIALELSLLAFGSSRMDYFNNYPASPHTLIRSGEEVEAGKHKAGQIEASVSGFILLSPLTTSLS